MHEHVEADLLLPAYACGRSPPSGTPHRRRRSVSPLPWAARALRTSAVCGKEPMVVVGKGGSSELAPAVAFAAPRTAAPLRHLQRQRAEPRGDVGIDAPWARRRARPPPLPEATSVSITTSRPPASAVAEGGELVHLLHGEGEPALHVRIEAGLLFEVDRHMQQRAGGGDLDMVGAAPAHHRLQRVEQLRQIGAPDIAPVDDAERQDEAGAAPSPTTVAQLLRRPRKIKMQPGDGQRQRGIEIVAEPAEIARRA